MNTGGGSQPNVDPRTQTDVRMDGDRVIRVENKRTALGSLICRGKQIVALRAFSLTKGHNLFFLHPDLRAHPTALACVKPLLNTIPSLREQDISLSGCGFDNPPSSCPVSVRLSHPGTPQKLGPSDHELATTPPSLTRSFMRNGNGGFDPGLP